MHKLSHMFLGIVFMIMGAAGVLGSTQLVFMDKGLPAPGFFPMVLSVLVFVFAALVLFSSLRTVSDSIDMAVVKSVSLFFLLLSVFMLLLPDIIGLLPTLGLFYILALRYWNGLSYGSAILNGVISTATLYVVFVVWLGVNMPWGVFTDWLY